MSFLAPNLDYATMSVFYLWGLGMVPHAIKLIIAHGAQGLFGYNNVTPRTTQWEKTTVAEHAALMYRLTACHQNGFEQIGLYGSTIALCKVAGLTTAAMAPVINMYFVSRILYTGVYAVHSSWWLTQVRTALFFGGIGLIGQLLVMAAEKLNK